MEFLHQGHKTAHVGAVLLYVRHGNILIRHADLNVVSEQELIVAHVILFQMHEGGRVAYLGIAVALFAADAQLLAVRL